MRKLLLLFLVGFIASPVFAQKLKVKTKDKVVYINDEAFLKWESSGVFSGIYTFTHASDDTPIFVIHYHRYGEKQFLPTSAFWTLMARCGMVLSPERNSMPISTKPRSSMMSERFSPKRNEGLRNLQESEPRQRVGKPVNEENARRFIRMYHEEPPTQFMIGQ